MYVVWHSHPVDVCTDGAEAVVHETAGTLALVICKRLLKLSFLLQVQVSLRLGFFLMF